MILEFRESDSLSMSEKNREILVNCRQIWRRRGYLLTKRIVDGCGAFTLLLVLSPMWITVSLLLSMKGPVFQRARKTGAGGISFDEFMFYLPANWLGRFLIRWSIHRIPTLFNILRGEISLIGPRALSLEDYQAFESVSHPRFSVKPGLICLWWIRSQSNIDYGTEWEADREYAEHAGAWYDTSIMLRALPTWFFGGPTADERDRVFIFGIPILNVTMDEAVRRIMESLDGESSQQVCFVNSDCVNIAFRDAAYRETLLEADTVLADGIGMKLAGKILRQNLRQNVNGTDLFPFLCKALDSSSKGMFLLGGKPGVAEEVREWIDANYPHVNVTGIRDGYFSEREEPDAIRQIADSGADLLLVAMGAPRQEMWIRQHLSETGVKVAMGVGGLFDFYSGRTPRAPVWMREIGMEWFYRFLQEPGRMWKRYFVGNFVFLFRVLKAKMGGG